MLIRQENYMKKKFNTVGKPVIRQDGLEKVTGQAKFTDDINIPGQLHGVMIRTSAVHAQIQNIDYSAIINNDHLQAICTHEDIPGAKKVGAIRQDYPIFAYEKIRTPGDVVAMLLGEDESQLNSLRNQIDIELKDLPVLTDAEKAMENGAPLIHESYGNNEIVHYPLRKGDVEMGFAQSDFILEQKYTTPLHEHAYLETEAVIAIPREGNKGVKIMGSIQNPHTARKVVALVLGWPLTKVRVEQAEMGGSFGGKDDTMNILAARAAVGAVKTGRPVKIKFDREESLLESYKRHPYFMNYKVGYMEDGTIKAMKINIIADGGAYASMSPFVTWRSVVQATGPYQIENVHTDIRAVYTNNPYTGAFRGFGSPQPIFAQESLMDEIAIRLNMTPEEVRLKNGFEAGSVTASGQQLKDHDVTLKKVLKHACQQTNFSEKWQQNFNQIKNNSPEFGSALSNDNYLLTEEQLIPPSQTWRRGIGLAVSYRGCSLGAEGIDAAAAYVSVQADGSVYVLSGLAENGQGLKTTFNIIAAEVLGISPENVVYLDPDTGYIPDSGPTVASRSTIMGGGAVKQAADTIRKRLEKFLQVHWNLKDEDELIFQKNSVHVKSIIQKKMSFSELCTLATGSGENLSALGWYKGPQVSWDEETGQGDAYFTYVYGCQVAEVQVNIATGEVYVEKVTAVHDPGTVINRHGAEGQVYGGVTQGMGYGLWEEVSCHQGKIRELNFDQYLIPTSKDIEAIDVHFIEGEETYGPWGAKSLGEPTLELGAAAVANAITNAVGQRFYNLPINLEELLLRRKLRPQDLKRGSE
jgi:CO/xanthine dehydrogenase Mo-binding subunit